jgi:hypothetical protein
MLEVLKKGQETCAVHNMLESWNKIKLKLQYITN